VTVAAGGRELTNGEIVGIVVGILLLFLLCAFCAFFLLTGKGKRVQKRGPPWVVKGAEGRAGIVDDEHFVDHSDYITASKEKFLPSIPLEHEVLIKGASSQEDKLNYESNVSFSLFQYSGKGGKELEDRNEINAQGLETILMGKRDDSSDSSSSHSSTSNGKGKKAEKVRHKTDMNLEEATEAMELLEAEMGHTAGIAKHDTTIIFNGQYYEEEDFEKHLAKSEKVRMGKRLKDKWKNNLLGIQEGEQDERPSEHISSSSSNNSMSRDSLHVDAKENNDNLNGESRFYQSTSFLDWSGGQGREEAERQQQGQNYAGRVLYEDSNKARRINSSDLVLNRHIETAEGIAVVNPTNTGIVVHLAAESFDSNSHSNTTSREGGRQFSDDHYYIGSSEYAEVVEEHVSGKYEGDLLYYEGKSKEVLDVETRIITKEELLNQFYECVEESEVQQRTQQPRIMTRGLEIGGAEKRLPVSSNQKKQHIQSELSPPTPLSPTASVANQYIEDWIQTENLPPPSSPDSGLSQRSLSPTGPVQRSDGEQDRSDESVIVTVNHRMVKRNNSDSGQSVSSSGSSSAYKHIADYLKIKQKAIKPMVQNMPRDQHVKQQETYNEEQKTSSSDRTISKAEQAFQSLGTSHFEQFTSPLLRQLQQHDDSGSTIASFDQEKRFYADTSSPNVKQGLQSSSTPGSRYTGDKTGEPDKLYSTNSSSQHRMEQQFLETAEARSSKQEQKPFRHEFVHVSDTYEIVPKDRSSKGKKSMTLKQEDAVKHNYENVAVHNGQDKDIVNRQYRITQQEIVFYLKKADGIIKVVRRPLISSGKQAKKVQNDHPKEKKHERSPMVRHLSQPDLRRSPPAHSDSTIVVEESTFSVEQYENVVMGQQAGNWDQLDHLENVGLLHHHHHGPSQAQVRVLG